MGSINTFHQCCITIAGYPWLYEPCPEITFESKRRIIRQALYDRRSIEGWIELGRIFSNINENEMKKVCRCLLLSLLDAYLTPYVVPLETQSAWDKRYAGVEKAFSTIRSAAFGDSELSGILGLHVVRESDLSIGPPETKRYSAYYANFHQLPTFHEALDRLEEQVRAIKELGPIMLRPNDKNAKEIYFSKVLSYWLIEYTRSPNHRINAAFTSALFNTDLSGNTISKRVGRKRRDASAQVKSNSVVDETPTNSKNDSSEITRTKGSLS